MNLSTKTNRPWIGRLLLLLLHALLSFALVSRLMDYDLTGSWLRFIGFVLLLLLLLFLFIRHILSFYSFLKKN